MEDSEKLALALLIGLALVVRIPNIGEPMIKQDEYSHYNLGAERADNFFNYNHPVWRGEPGQDIQNTPLTDKPALPYLYHGIWQKIGSALTLDGGYETMRNFSRLGTAILGMFNVLVIYFVGKRLFGFREGISAAAVYALIPSIIEFSRYTKEETMMFLMMSLSVLVLLKTEEWKTWKKLGAVGLFTGLTFASKYTGLMVIPIVAFLWAWTQDGIIEKYTDLRKITEYDLLNKGANFGVISAALTSVSFVVLVIVFPYLWPAPLSNFASVVAEWVGGGSGEGGFFLINMISKTATNLPEFLIWWGLKTPLPILLLGAAGIYFAYRKENRYLLPLLVWMAIPFSTVILKRAFPRFSLAAAMPLALFAGYGLVKLYEAEKIQNIFSSYRTPLIALVVYLLAISFLVHPHAQSAYFTEAVGFGYGAYELSESGNELPDSAYQGEGQGMALNHIYENARPGSSVQLYVEPSPLQIGVDRRFNLAPPTEEPQANYVALNAKYAYRFDYPPWWTRMTDAEEPDVDASLTFQEMERNPNYQKVWETGGMGFTVAAVYRRIN